MSDKLKDFLIELSANADKRNRYLRDPNAEMAGAGLSDAEKAALKTGDSGEIERMLKPSIKEVLQSIICVIFVASAARPVVPTPTPRRKRDR